MQKYATVLALLVQQTVRAAVVQDIGGRELANVAYGVAISGMGVLLGVLFVALASAAQSVGKCNAQELVNMAWGFATADWQDDLLFAVLARAAEQRVGKFHA